MAKTLIFNYKDKDYTLEFTRKSIQQMERNGFIASDIQAKPMTSLPELFAGAFIAHHRYEKREVIDDIFNHMTNKEELIGKLAEMYNDPIMSLVEEPKDNAGNVEWAADF